jgi:predicted proteasome-type protease
MCRVRKIDAPELEESGSSFSTNFPVGRTDRGGSAARLFHIYPEGNFIEATADTPFFQIGEHKYGKPIIDRVVEHSMRLGEAAKLALVSFARARITQRSVHAVKLPPRAPARPEAASDGTRRTAHSV